MFGMQTLISVEVINSTIKAMWDEKETYELENVLAWWEEKCFWRISKYTWRGIQLLPLIWFNWVLKPSLALLIIYFHCHISTFPCARQLAISIIITESQFKLNHSHMMMQKKERGTLVKLHCHLKINSTHQQKSDLNGTHGISMIVFYIIQRKQSVNQCGPKQHNTFCRTMQ